MADESFRSRLITAMSEMVNPSKSSVATVPTKGGGRYTYKYETLEQMLAAIRPALLSQGLGLTQGMVWDPSRNAYVLRTKVFDSTGEMVLDERPFRDGGNAQELGSWETYMRRYALRTAFGLCGEDDDGAATVRGQQRQQPAPQQPQQTPQPQPEKPSEQWVQSALVLKQECVRNGIREGALDDYARSMYGTADVREMSRDQLAKYGQYLRTTAEQSRKEK